MTAATIAACGCLLDRSQYLTGIIILWHFLKLLCPHVGVGKTWSIVLAMREWRSSVMSTHLKEEGLWKITAITVLSDHNHPKMKTSYCAGSSLLQDVKGPVHRSRGVSEWFDELEMIVGTSQSQKRPGRILHTNNGLQQSSRNVENQCQDELKLFCLHLSFQIQLFALHCIVSERLKQKDSDKRIQSKAKYCRWSHRCM